jgi:transcription elongation factor GreA
MRFPVPRRLLTGTAHALSLVNLENYPEEPSSAPADLTVRPAAIGVPVTETRDDHVTWLTQEAYDRLKAELDHLSGPGRVEIANKINAARDEGDLRENGGYHAAKEEQGKQEARINQIQHILQNAKVGEPPRTDGVVGPGMTVTVRFDGDDEEVTFLLASREESGSPIDVYSPRSPLGSAISGKKVGETATYTMPNGRAASVEILEAVPYGVF